MKICMNCMQETENSICPHCGYDNNKEQSYYALKRGTVLKGRYLIGRVLGQGGFGITYVGMDRTLEMKIAIKEYYPSGFVTRDGEKSNSLTINMSALSKGQWEKGCESFIKEARKMAKLDSMPQIVSVRDVFIENNTAYIIMEYVEGITLKDYVDKNGPLEFNKCLELYKPLIKNLEYVHTKGIIHRDISPDNIMYTPDGRLYLLDLGAAKDLTVKEGVSSQQVVKKCYSPIEQYMQSTTVGPWTDVYAICASIVYCSSGETIPEATDRIFEDGISLDLPFKGGISDKVKTVLLNGLAVKPEDRIQTMKELLAAFNNTESEPEPKPKPESNTKPEPKPKTSKSKFIIAAMAVIAIIGLGSMVPLVSNSVNGYDVKTQNNALKAFEKIENSNEYFPYCIYDMDQDGVPELITQRVSSEGELGFSAYYYDSKSDSSVSLGNITTYIDVFANNCLLGNDNGLCYVVKNDSYTDYMCMSIKTKEDGTKGAILDNLAGLEKTDKGTIYRIAENTVTQQEYEEYIKKLAEHRLEIVEARVTTTTSTSTATTTTTTTTTIEAATQAVTQAPAAQPANNTAPKSNTSSTASKPKTNTSSTGSSSSSSTPAQSQPAQAAPAPSQPVQTAPSQPAQTAPSSSSDSAPDFVPKFKTVDGIEYN